LEYPLEEAMVYRASVLVGEAQAANAEGKE
jgi:hypothetical protein